MTRFIVSFAVVLGVLVPSFAFAQSTSNALLSVYVQVINPSQGSVYNYPYNTSTRTPADFSVQVSGNSPSPSTFWGSQNAVQVSLNPGAYNVTIANNPYGYTADYSAGCNNTAVAGGTGSCVITLSPNYSAYYPYGTNYPYQNVQPALSCQPVTQTAGLRQNVRFTAVGGVGGTYNWRTASQNYPNVGPVLTVAFDQTGSQLVTVTNANQSATCEVTVTQGYFNPATVTNPTYPTYTTGYSTGNAIYTNYGTPTLTPTYYPRLPNTGVEPLTLAQLMIALALLGAAVAVGAPYLRKAFAIVTR
ncbi:MAG: hypothetical protein V4474_03080 [Patescibacteria group bacterium]